MGPDEIVRCNCRRWGGGAGDGWGGRGRIRRSGPVTEALHTDPTVAPGMALGDGPSQTGPGRTGIDPPPVGASEVVGGKMRCRGRAWRSGF